MTKTGPLSAYQRAIEHEGFVADGAQWQAAQMLQTCHDALHRKNANSAAINGVYLSGPVGRGKTWLLDRFYESLQVPARRSHFHHFMHWVHRRLFALTGTSDPLKTLARELRAEIRVLCFDEFFVSDIGDAMLLGRLLQYLFAHDLVLVLTSNQAPEQLYADGFNRERFVPAIEAIERHMSICRIDAGQDHRLHPGLAHQRYWLQSSPHQSTHSENPLAGIFTRLTQNAASSDEPFTLGHRRINVVRRSADVLWCRYADLCEQALSALDFIALCAQFSVVLLSAVPCLSGRPHAGYIARGTEDGAVRVLAGERQLPMLSVHDDSVRRFIALVDECYDRRIPIYIEAEVPLLELYTEGYLLAPFRRALSRLQAMQWQRYGVTAPA